ncbi:UDP-glucose 4-epimerase GalE [Azospirillum halopraeferens]|uniref:UDP-glucose 4-epimerase GalE n=1 Tax=Azospirillum halopraeferens TaxID=34010 RepID=UPI00041888DC|nr:UDP-glucose 4-epimerase GalE [Azospirillum halopraeferens]
MATVLVTGGAGYIGSHACKALARAGHHPVVFDDLSRGWRDAVRWGPLEVGDVRDPAALDAAFRRHRPGCVMHFAALTAVGESVVDPAAYYGTNVGGTLALLDAMRRHEVPCLVFSSTCAIYGLPGRVPMDEDTPAAPINPYGAGKWMVERLLADYAAAYGLRTLALRYFNAAGADPEGDIGERHEPETHAVPLAILAALGRRDRFRVLGTDYPTPDGTAVRDYVHVDDLAAAHVLAAERLMAGGAGGAFNLGTGRGTSVLDLLRAVERVAGRPVPVEFAPRRPGDAPVLVAAAERVRDALGWRPSCTSIDAIVETAWHWHRRT